MLSLHNLEGMSKFAIGHVRVPPGISGLVIIINQSKTVTYREEIPATHELIPRGRLSLIKLLYERSKVAILYVV